MSGDSKRRVRFAVVVLVSQLLLIAMSVAWVVHGIIIARNGSAYFIEDNPWILWGEIIATILITVFGIYVFAVQYRRLKERRGDDRRGK